MKPLDKPCYYCNGTKQHIFKGMFGKMPVIMAMCKKCTNIAFFMSIADTDQHKVVPIEQVPAEVREKFGI